jgi:iron-sulfur cluster repair protein YtfE (RIC family)
VADSSDVAAIPEPGLDPVLAMLQSLTREGTIMAAFASAHESFHRYNDAARRVALSAPSDRRALEQLRSILNDYLNHFHEHHTAEENYLFPALCRVDPSLNTVLDQLRDQHMALTGSTKVVRGCIDAIDETNAERDIPALVVNLESLHALVVEHLAFEEAVTVPVVSRWPHWPE